MTQQFLKQPDEGPEPPDPDPRDPELTMLADMNAQTRPVAVADVIAP